MNVSSLKIARNQEIISWFRAILFYLLSILHDQAVSACVLFSLPKQKRLSAGETNF